MTRSILIAFFLFTVTTLTVFADEIAGFANEDALRRALGLNPLATRAYTKQGFSWGAYGELLYHKYAKTTFSVRPNFVFDFPTGKDQELSLARGVLFLGYKHSDRLVFNSEIRGDRDLIEQGVATFTTDYIPGVSKSNINVDLAYVDYILSPELTLRGGILLVPMGLINEFHQPTEYLGTRPALADLYTIPSIWHALGFGAAGHILVFDYRAYLINGLNAAKFTEFGWRGAREITSDTIAHPAFVVRIDYNPFPGGVLGGSYYVTNSGIFGLDVPVDLKIRTTLKELHGELRWKGAFARAEYAKGLIEDSPELNRILGKAEKRGIAKRVVGGYVEGGWNFFWNRQDGTMLMPYLRGEASNPQDALPPDSLALGLVKNHQLDFIIWIIGAEYRPIPALSIKAEFERIHDEDDIGWHEFHIDTSFAF